MVLRGVVRLIPIATKLANNTTQMPAEISGTAQAGADVQQNSAPATGTEAQLQRRAWSDLHLNKPRGNPQASRNDIAPSIP